MEQYFDALIFYAIPRKTIKRANEEPEGLFLTATVEENYLASDSFFLRDEYGKIYGVLKVRKNLCIKELPEDEFQENDLQQQEKSYRLFMQNIKEFIGFWFDGNFVPKFVDGAVKEITGYDKDDFYLRNLKWTELIVPDDKQLFFERARPKTYFILISRRASELF